MRKPALPYSLLAQFARMRAERRAELYLPSAKGVTLMKPYTHVEPRTEVSDAALASGDLNAWKQVLGFTPPRDPSQVPDGDLSDAVKNDNPTPSDFNDDEEEDDGFDDDEDDTVAGLEDDDD